MATTERQQKHEIAAVDSREELIYLLSRAAELEHGLACVYLFAAYSLKSDASEGGVPDEYVAKVREWKGKLAKVAIEEMLHLAQVANLLTAIGGAPHLRRTNFPVPANAFPLGLQMTLEPFSRELIERLLCFEMPEPGILPPERQSEFDRIRNRICGPLHPCDVPRVRGTEPFEVDFHTVGELYRKIESGFAKIPQRRLFIGPPEAQAKAEYLDLVGQLLPVVDRDSACRAIEMIIKQGESPTDDHPDAHFNVFDSIRVEFERFAAEAAQRGVLFDPVRPVVANPMTRRYDDSFGGSIITDKHALAVADLFNSAYDTMLLMLLRLFAHSEENEQELRTLARATLDSMTAVLRPLGEALTKMPAGSQYPQKTAGPGFGYNRDVHLLPHKASAWTFFSERLAQLVARATAISKASKVPPDVLQAARALERVAHEVSSFATAAPAGSAQTPSAPQDQTKPTIRPSLNGPYVVAGLERLTNSKGATLNTRPQMALCRCGGSSTKPFCDGTHARIGFDSAKSPDRKPDHRVDYVGREVTIHDNRGTCCHAGYCTDNVPTVFREDAEPWIDPDGAGKDAIISIVRRCPSGALSYSLGDQEFRDQDRPPAVFVSKDGPYHVQGGIALADEEFNEGASREHYALCRCGQSKNKPFCDGSHWYVGFKDDAN
jgi:CDGSH-type Zn-finger protein